MKTMSEECITAFDESKLFEDLLAELLKFKGKSSVTQCDTFLLTPKELNEPKSKTVCILFYILLYIFF